MKTVEESTKTKTNLCVKFVDRERERAAGDEEEEAANHLSPLRISRQSVRQSEAPRDRGEDHLTDRRAN